MEEEKKDVAAQEKVETPEKKEKSPDRKSVV